MREIGTGLLRVPETGVPSRRLAGHFPPKGTVHGSLYPQARAGTPDRIRDALYRALREQKCRAVHEPDNRGGVVDVEAGLHGAEGALAAGIARDGQHGRPDQVEEVPVPEVGLDDPQPSDELVIGAPGHAGP